MKLFIGFALIMLSIFSVLALPKGAAAASSYSSRALTISCSDVSPSARFTLKNNSRFFLYALQIKSLDSNTEIGPVIISPYPRFIQLPVKPQEKYKWSLKSTPFIGRVMPWRIIDQGIFFCNVSFSPSIEQVNVAPCGSSSCQSITTIKVLGKGFDPEAKVELFGLRAGKSYEGVIAGRTADSEIIVDFHSLDCSQVYKTRVINPNGRSAIQKDILKLTGCLAG